MKVLWFVSSLEQKGGGERFVLEAVRALRALGVEAHIVCDRLDEAASFDGLYDLSEVICTARAYDGTGGYVRRVLNKAGGIFALHSVIKRMKPDLVICQSEFDAVRLYCLSRVLPFRYRAYVFGQMFQFRTDISRYSNVFRQHLETIVASRPGYRSTVTLPPPRLPFLVNLTNEIVSRFKYRALHAADRLFTLSYQVQWECGLLYDRPDAVAAPAAFDASFIDTQALANPRPVARPMRLLSVSRLAEKKRIELTIAGFSASRVEGDLFLIGTGPEEARLRALAEASPRRDQIHFLGSVDDERLHRELEQADCFISMDIGDYDISVVEALGKGKRVIIPHDFDIDLLGRDYAGVAWVPPEAEAITQALEALETMPPPSLANVPALERLTWQNMANTVIAA